MKLENLPPEQEVIWTDQFNQNLMRYVQCFARVKDELQFVMNLDSQTIHTITKDLIELTENTFGI